MRISPLLFGVLLAASASAQSPKASPGPGPLKATFIGNEAWHITDGEYTVLTDFPYQSGYSGYIYMTWLDSPSK